MFASIALKLKGSLGMFWQALEDDERRWLLMAAVYLAVSGYSYAAARSRARFKAEIIEEARRAR